MEFVQDKRHAHLAEIEASLPPELKEGLKDEMFRVCGGNYRKMAEFRREWLLAYERLKAETN